MVRGTLIAVEPVAGVRVPDDVPVDGRVFGEYRAQLLEVIDRDALVRISEQAQPRCLEVSDLADERRCVLVAEPAHATGHSPDNDNYGGGVRCR